MVNRLMWIWCGVDPREILEVQVCIIMSEAKHTDRELYDTVVSHYGGSWIYGWAKQAIGWQRKTSMEGDPQMNGRHWLHVSTLYNIAAYPHLKGDGLAEQAQILTNHAYGEAA